MSRYFADASGTEMEDARGECPFNDEDIEDIRSESDRLLLDLADKLTEPWLASSDPKKTLGELRKEIMECHRQIVLHARSIRARNKS